MPMAKPVPTNHPTDKGWAWVTCLASAIANFYVTGGVRSIGILSVELNRYYNPNPVLVQLVTAFMGAGFAIFSFFGNILGVRFSMHRIAILGACITIVGHLIAVFAPNMLFVILGLGVLCGIGYGFMFGPSMVLVGQYFVQRRSLANGMAIAGGSCGQLIIPWFIFGVMNMFAFRGGMLMYLGLALQAIPAMCLLRETSFYGPKPTSTESQDEQRPSVTSGKLRVNQQYNTADKILYPSKVPAIGDLNISLAEHRPSVMMRHQQHRPSIISLSAQMAQEFMSVSVEDIAGRYNVDPENVTPQMRRRQMLRMICDPDLVCNPLFLVFVLAIGIGHGGYMSTCFFIPLYTNELWGSESLNAALISLMGVSDLIGRVLGGYIADLNLLPKPYLVAISFMFCSIMVLLMPFIAKVGVIFTCAILFGLVGGSYLSMLVVIIVELFGEPKLPVGLGLTTLTMGLMMLPIPPTFAGLARRSGTYGTAIRLAGLLMIVGAGLFAIVVPVWKHRRCRVIPETSTVGVQTSLALPPPTSSARSAPSDVTEIPAVTKKLMADRKFSGARQSVDGSNYRWSRLNDEDTPESNL